MIAQRFMRMAGAVMVAAITACASTPPTIGVDSAGNITISNIPADVRCVRAVIEGRNMNRLEFPGTSTMGLPANTARVSNGSVTIPVGASMAQRVEIGSITVYLDPGCAEITGTFRYTGNAFDLGPGQRRTLPCSDFDRD